MTWWTFVPAIGAILGVAIWWFMVWCEERRQQAIFKDIILQTRILDAKAQADEADVRLQEANKELMIANHQALAKIAAWRNPILPPRA